MLRITQSHNIAFQKKEPFFSTNFAIGLLIALLFHLSIFLIFRIASMPSMDILQPLLPTSVEIDLSTESVDLLPEVQMTHFALDPPSDFELCWEVPLKPEPYSLKKIQIRDPEFNTLEKIEYRKHTYDQRQ